MPGEVLNDSTAGQEDLLAVYTRKSTDEGLDKEFNTLDAHANRPKRTSAVRPAKAGCA